MLGTKLIIKCGAKSFNAYVNAEFDDSVANVDEIYNANLDESIKTVGDLRQFIANETNTDSEKIKIIYKGKFIGFDNNESLKNYGFKNLDKLMVMGVPKQTINEDDGFALLTEYEKKHLNKLNETFVKNGKELAELEKNFLEGFMVKEMIKRMEKHLQTFTQIGLSHLESIDALQIYNDQTIELQKTRNREKRKELINMIQDLLNRNDTLLFQLNQYTFKVEHPNEGH